MLTGCTQTNEENVSQLETEETTNIVNTGAFPKELVAMLEKALYDSCNEEIVQAEEICDRNMSIIVILY